VFDGRQGKVSAGPCDEARRGLASSTSTLDARQIAAFWRHWDMISTRFFSPANIMKLLEVVHSARENCQKMCWQLSGLGQKNQRPRWFPVCDGFIIHDRAIRPSGRIFL
jgi:3-hydroxyacyl-CoA dehydrogenase